MDFCRASSIPEFEDLGPRHVAYSDSGSGDDLTRTAPLRRELPQFDHKRVLGKESAVAFSALCQALARNIGSLRFPVRSSQHFSQPQFDLHSIGRLARQFFLAGSRERRENAARLNLASHCALSTMPASR